MPPAPCEASSAEVRWDRKRRELGEKAGRLPLDTFGAALLCSYLGPFPGPVREELRAALETAARKAQEAAARRTLLQ